MGKLLNRYAKVNRLRFSSRKIILIDRNQDTGQISLAFMNSDNIKVCSIRIKLKSEDLKKIPSVVDVQNVTCQKVTSLYA